MSTFSYVAARLLITVCVIWKVLPSMVSGRPSLNQETVVAGEPVEVQVKVEANAPRNSWIPPVLSILGGAV